MHHCITAILLMYIPLITASELDEWVIDNSRDFALSFFYGTDEFDGSLRGASLSLPFIDYSRLETFYNRVDTVLGTETIDINQHGITWLSDVQQTWSGGLGYEFTGKNNVIEIEDKILLGQYSGNSWLVQLKYLAGDLKVYTIESAEDELSLLTRIRGRLGDYIAIQRNGLGIVTGMEQERWDWRVSLTSYDYNRDLNRIRENLVQYYFQIGAVNQLYQLSNWEINGDVMCFFDNFSLILGINAFELHVEEKINNQLYTGIDLPVSDIITVGILFNYMTEDSTLFSEVSLNFHW